MNKVVTINLAGRAYQLEEGAYDALRAYLDEAALKLGSNPDKDEIIGDLESAIGQKCSVFLDASKNVVTRNDMRQILDEMGPVDAGSSESGSTDAGEAGMKSEKSGSAHAHKRLYRLDDRDDGAMIFGICNGLAAYFDIDVTLVRILFVILAFITSGAFVAVYFVMMLVIPEAETPQERAAAFGGMPPNAQEVVDRVQKGYREGMKHWRDWQQQSREQRRQQRRQWRRMQHHQYRYHNPAQSYPYPRTWIDELVGSVIGMAWLVFFGFCAWFGYGHVPIVREFFDQIPGWIQQFVAWVRAL